MTTEYDFTAEQTASLEKSIDAAEMLALSNQVDNLGKAGFTTNEMIRLAKKASGQEIIALGDQAVKLAAYGFTPEQMIDLACEAFAEDITKLGENLAAFKTAKITPETILKRAEDGALVQSIAAVIKSQQSTGAVQAAAGEKTPERAKA